MIMTEMRNTIIIIFISSVLFIQGCSGKEEFTNVFIEESSDGTKYKCVFKQKEINDMETKYSFILTKEPNPQNHSLHMEGKVQCMALCENSNLLVIAFIPLEPIYGPNPAGYTYLSSDYEVIFVNTDTLKESHRWKIKPKKKQNNEEEDLQRFDEIVLSDDGKKVVTYYWKDYKEVIIIWDVKTGKSIQEFKLPPDNPALRGVIHGVGITDIIISSDNKFVACAGAWSVKGKGSHDIEPGSFLYVWRIKDSKCFELRFEKTYYLRKLCFDTANKYIACHNGTTIMVFRIDNGKLIHSQNANYSVLKINWNKSKKAFQIKVKEQPDLFIAPSEL